MSKLEWLWANFTSRLWLRATLFCVIGILTALFALVAKDFIPEDMSRKVGADAVDAILHILATSMLAVTTFSLSTLVAAYTAASTSATPRSIRLLLEDRTAQNALSTFIGSFLFSLVGIIALQMGIYGDSGRLVLFVVTLAVIFIITAMLLQWVDHLTQLGRVGKTIDMVERATEQAITQRLSHPYLGGIPLRRYNPDTGHYPVHHPRIGYVQHIDVEKLSALAETCHGHFYLMQMPGSFNDRHQPLLYSDTELSDAQQDVLRDAYSMGGERTFPFDPHYGLIVLSEIASRALSPGVNDPGTAIDVIGTAYRLLQHWLSFDSEDAAVLYPQLHVPGLELEEVFDDIFNPIARDGAALIEVGTRLQSNLASLGRSPHAECAALARHHAQLALKRAHLVMNMEEDKEKLSAIAAWASPNA